MAICTPKTRPRAPRARRCAALGLLALAVAALAPALAAAAPAGYAGSSADGSRVFFTTTEKLVPGDTDNRRDVYERSYDAGVGTYVTREVSIGPTGGNDAFDATYEGSSADGTKVFFSTAESLVPADTDHSSDVYMRDLTTGTTTLVSQGAASCAPGCGNGPDAASFAPGGATPDGSRVFFVTEERLAPEDTDNSVDVYMRDLTTGTTTLVSQGAASCAPGCGNGAFPAVFQGASASGAKAFFTTAEPLAAGDADSLVDIYQRDLGTNTTTLVSTTGTCPASLDCSAVFARASSDGSHVFYETNERVSSADTDNSSDVYDWSGGTATLVSIGPAGGNGAPAATFAGSSAGGSDVFFETSESLVSADTDTAQDIYERSGGTTTLVSQGDSSCAPGCGNGDFPASFDKASPDGSTVIFTTAESLAGTDTDTSRDVYVRSAGTTTLASTSSAAGNGAFDASFAGASDNGSAVFFETAEPMVSLDTDASPDIYERAAGDTTLVSTGPLGGNGAFDPNLTAVSGDGSRAFFLTDERLTVDDLDTETDVYDHSATGTLLVSVGNSVQLGPATPSLTGTSPASPGTSTTPAILGQADPNTAIKVYATPDCSGAPVATGTSVELGGAGIAVTVAAGSTTTFHATATDTNGDTSACSSDSVTYQQVADSGGGGGGSGGSSGGGTGGTGGGTGGTTGGGTGPTPPPSSGSNLPAVAPKVRITFAPAAKTRARRPVFRFVDATGQAGTRFLCKLDRRRWRRCRSPQRLKRLRPGRHVFRVMAIAADGTKERRPAKRRFRLVRR